MFTRLKNRWKVNNGSLLLIICTFALGGSLCGYAGRKILLLTGIEKGFGWIVLYIILITLIWPICVILVSIPLGQFSFFKKYLTKMADRFRYKGNQSISIAIFASGAGSNAQKIIEEFSNNKKIKVKLIVCNKPGAGVLEIANKAGISSMIIEKTQFFEGDHYLPILEEYKIDFIVLAGFLWKIPPVLIQAYPDNIINIHPALLPKYGGKGMYGSKVHEAVIAAGDMESGITIHYVDELYDHGKIILQANCTIEKNETAETLAQKIHELEHTHYPAVIEKLLNAK